LISVKVRLGITLPSLEQRREPQKVSKFSEKPEKSIVLVAGAKISKSSLCYVYIMTDLKGKVTEFDGLLTKPNRAWRLIAAVQ
jgi:hypothetical protein